MTGWQLYVFRGCQWVTLHVLAHLYFLSATSHPRMQNPCFKLQVFIIDVKVRQEDIASLGGDVDCLFFAVKRNKSVVNISWCSCEHQETPTTYRNKFPGTEIVVHQALMHGFSVHVSSMHLRCACLELCSFRQLNSSRNWNGWEAQGKKPHRIVALWPLQELRFEAVVAAVVQLCSGR